MHTSQALLQPHLRSNQDINQPVRWDAPHFFIFGFADGWTDNVFWIASNTNATIYIYDFYGYIEHSWHPAHQISALLILVMVSIMSFKTAPKDDPEFSGLWNGMSQLSSAHKLHLRLLLQDKIWPRTRLGWPSWEVFSYENDGWLGEDKKIKRALEGLVSS